MRPAGAALRTRLPAFSPPVPTRRAPSARTRAQHRGRAPNWQDTARTGQQRRALCTNAQGLSRRSARHLLNGLGDRHRARVGVLLILAFVATLLLPGRSILLVVAAACLLLIIPVVAPAQVQLVRALPQGNPREREEGAPEEGAPEARPGRRVRSCCAGPQVQRTPHRSPAHTQPLRAPDDKDGQ